MPLHRSRGNGCAGEPAHGLDAQPGQHRQQVGSPGMLLQLCVAHSYCMQRLERGVQPHTASEVVVGALIHPVHFKGKTDLSVGT